MLTSQKALSLHKSKPLKQTFNKTSKDENLSEQVMGTNFDNRPITEQRMREICEELGFNLDLED